MTNRSLAARALALARGGVPSRQATEVLTRELGLSREVVEQAVTDAFAAFSGHKRDKLPVARAARGSRSFDVMLQHKSQRPRLDPLSALSAEERSRLSPADRHAIARAVEELNRALAEHALSGGALPYIPVFGYLSLRNRNADVLGKPQDEVRPGVDVVDAELPGWDVGVVLSTLYRGSPEHPGAVAGLSEREGAHTPGALLKLPLDRADELLGKLFLREMVGESDLRDRDARTSNGMYIPRVLDVKLDDGSVVPALVFVTNPEGAKNPAKHTGEELSVGQLAYFMLGAGGFTGADGTQYGGASVDYWEKSYLALKRTLAEPVNPTIAAAVDVAKLIQQQGTSAAALPALLDGAFVPLDTVRYQKPDT